MTDRPYGDDADEDDVSTGDFLDAMFEVETSGEALPLDIGDDAPEPVVVDDAEFALGPQVGEDLPPELQEGPSDEPAPPDGDELFAPVAPGPDHETLESPVAGLPEDEPFDDLFEPMAAGAEPGEPPAEDLAGGDTRDDEWGEPFSETSAVPGGYDEPPLELDPTDPGFTADDLAEDGPAEDGPADAAAPDIAETPGDSVPTSDWLLGNPPPPEEPGDEGGIPAGYEFLFRDEEDEDGGPVESPDWSDEDPSAGAGAFPADFDLPDWAALSDETITSTTEYADLAEEVARSAGMVAEPSAVAANMPGLDTGLVGLEDVVGEAPAPPAPPTSQPDLALRALTGIGLVALFGVALLWSNVLAALATLVFVAAAGELYAVLRANGYRPVAFVGLPGVVGAIVGTWVWGLGAVPVALLLTLVALALQMAMAGPPRRATEYGVGYRQGPLQDASLTMLGAVWVGGLGAFALPIITADDYRWLMIAVIAIVVGLDVGQYFVGRRMGKRPLAPVVSPKKTVEGLAGGAVVALAVAAALWLVSPLPLIPLLVTAAAAVVLGPLGDLSVSVVKRTLGVKDMGTILPGHGGILDRIDALLFVLPAAWLVFQAAGLLS